MLLKLAPSPTQSTALLDTMHAFNDACTAIAEVAFVEKLANKFELQTIVYGDIRKQYGLSAQLTIRAISKVVDSYKRDKSIKPSFRREGAVTYDERVMSFKGLYDVSLLTLQGRVLIPLRMGGSQEARFDRIKGQADLLYRNGAFSLAVTLDAPEPSPIETTDILGVDLGIVNLATDSTGETFSGQAVEKTRQRYQRLRTVLQKRGTKSAKRHLKKLSGKQARFQRNTNHVISKHLVQKAKANSQGIAIEELRHIRSRTEARLTHYQRSRHSNWSFAQLRFSLSYKAALAGVPLHVVNPASTSRTCSVRGSCAKENCKSQAVFLCQSCGHGENADGNAAKNISRASVMVPLVGSETSRNNRLVG